MPNIFTYLIFMFLMGNLVFAQSTNKVIPMDSVMKGKPIIEVYIGEQKSSLTTQQNNLDTDNDGILNAEDDCPDVKGKSAFFGCPPPPLDKEMKVEIPDVIGCSFGPIAPAALNLKALQRKINYPQMALEKKIEGLVILRVFIDEQGNYIKHLVVAEGNPILLREVEKRIKEIQFSPAIGMIKPVKLWVDIPFNFKIKDLQ